MPQSLPKTAIISQIFKSVLRLCIKPARPALLFVMWFIILPLFVRESLWLSIVTFDNFFTHKHASSWPFTSDSAENTVVTFAKYFTNDVNGGANLGHFKNLDPRTQVIAVHTIEGIAIFVTYLIISFVVVMVREWIVQHEVPMQAREAMGVRPAPAPPVAFDRPLNLPPLPEGLHENMAQRMQALRERILREPNDRLALEEMLQAIQQPWMNEGVPEQRDANLRPRHAHAHEFAPDAEADENDDVVFVDQLRDPEFVGLAEHPEVQAAAQEFRVNQNAAFEQFPLEEELDDELGDDLDGILQFIGIGGPLANMFISFMWVVGAAFVVNMSLVTWPFINGRIVVALVGLIATYGAHLSAHFGNVTLDAIFFLLRDVPGLKLGPTVDTSLSDIFKRPIDFTYANLFWDYVWSAHPKSFFDGLAYVLLGNFLLIMACATYVNSNFRFATSISGRRTEESIIRALNHIGDILKVITITGIELVTFPIFCGILLSAALLPLFPSETFYDRLLYTLNHPFDSPLLYWFTGTFYMFQLAMFVTMCRENIMRRGVLYFVRDPNEPNFHPIKEIMDRRLIPQLRKIAISGVMYAILICVCIGGVVWPLRYVFHVSFLPLTFDFVTTRNTFSSIPPLYSLLLHCAVLTLLRFVAYFRPVSIINKVWDAVFLRACAKLRLSSFILNRPVPYERGTVHYGSLMAWFSDVQPDYSKPGTLEDVKNLPADKAIFVLDGVFVRAPATDSAAAKKELKLFIEVDKDDNRIDGNEDGPNDLKEYTVVYTPPHFRWRVFGLLCAIWAVGAIIVFSVTGLPIIVGRFMLSFIYTPKQIDENNLFAFAIGILPTLLAITAIDWRTQLDDYRKVGFQKLWDRVATVQRQGQIRKSVIGFIKLALFLFVYFVIIPLLLIYTLHKFILEPMHAFLSFSFEDWFTIYRNVWSWSIVTQIVLVPYIQVNYPNSMAGRVLNRIFQNGYMDMDLVFAIRGMLYPILGFLIIHFVPQSLRFMGEKLISRGLEYRFLFIMRDYSYICGISSIALAAVTFLAEFFWRRWETSLRDEVYLVTEQLENL